MKSVIGIALVACLFGACTAKDTNRFTVKGNLKNATDQTVFLEEMFFSQRNPEILDSAKCTGGVFSLGAVAKEQGMYRVRLGQDGTYFIFINDAKVVDFSADMKNLSLTTVDFATPANQQMKAFIQSVTDKRMELDSLTKQARALEGTKGADSLVAVLNEKGEALQKAYGSYIVNYLDTVKHPVLALFAFGFTKNINPTDLEKPMDRLKKRFPGNGAIATMADQFNTMLAQRASQQNQPAPATPTIGSMAPDISMPDTDGNTFALSQMRGKYVLVDFWASWCGPCRNENPNVVKAFTRFKTKNFTILGVSLDKDKDAWVNAIKEDGLEWKQISDLKYWSSAAVGLYGFQGIPYNVLVDPSGKIVAEGLRGEALEAKLQELLDK
jgi:peroxiredoxin